VAVIVAVPIATAVTRPFASTVAFAWSLVLHVTALFATSPVTEAVNVAVSPTRRLALGGVTVTTVG
jgi:hypothetical protein